MGTQSKHYNNSRGYRNWLMHARLTDAIGSELFRRRTDAYFRGLKEMHANIEGRGEGSNDAGRNIDSQASLVRDQGCAAVA
jgi:hypothetical protein